MDLSLPTGLVELGQVMSFLKPQFLLIKMSKIKEAPTKGVKSLKTSHTGPAPENSRPASRRKPGTVQMGHPGMGGGFFFVFSLRVQPRRERLGSGVGEGNSPCSRSPWFLATTPPYLDFFSAHGQQDPPPGSHELLWLLPFPHEVVFGNLYDPSSHTPGELANPEPYNTQCTILAIFRFIVSNVEL